MAEIGSAFVTIAPSAQGFGRSLSSQVDGQTRTAGSTIGRTFGKMFVLGAGIIAAAGIGNLLKGSIDEAREAQKVGAATEAIIKATGGAARITADQVGAMAGRLSAVTGIDDEVIQSGSNLLLTFKNVKNFVDGEFVGIFDRATASAVDLSAAGFGSVESSSKMLGKALNDPLKGISALSRAGVTFSEQQKEQIANFVETGDVAKAQNLILKEVESQVGGVAAATATSGEKAAVAFGNLKEQIGTALLPVVDRLAEAFTTTIAPAISNFVANLQTGEGGAGRFGAFLSNSVVPALRMVGAFITGSVIPALRSFGGFVISDVLPVLQQYGDYLLTKVVPAMRDALVPIIRKAQDAFDSIRAAVRRNKPELTQLFNAFKKVAEFIQTKVIPTQIKLASNVLPVLGFAIKAIITAAAFLVKAFNKVVDIFSTVRNGVESAIAKFKAFKTGIETAAKGAKAAISKHISSALGPINTLIATLQKAIDKFNELKGKGGGHKSGGPPKTAGRVVGEEFGRTFAEGVARTVASSTGKVTKATQKMLDKLKSQLDTVKSDFAGLRDSVAGAFTGNLFESETASGFISDLLGTKGQLEGLKAAFAKLIGWGLKPEFLSQLFQSGNGGLILDLAAGTKDQAAQANALFGDVSSLSTSLGASVADAKFGDKLDGIRQEIKELRKDQKGNARETGSAVGREINSAARGGRRLARV